jgi:hypothetical protein
MNIQQYRRFPVVIASLAALVLCAILLAGYLLGARARAVDPRVTLDTASPLIHAKHRSAAPQVDVISVMESEPSRTAARIGEATALAFSISLYSATEQLKGRTPHGVRDLVAGVIAAGVLPPDLALTEKEGTLASAQGTLAIRYRPTPLAVEVVSLTAKPGDGPALLIRLPEESSDQGEARLYMASNLKDLRIPSPFAPAAEVIALGWSPETLRSLR